MIAISKYENELFEVFEDLILVVEFDGSIQKTNPAWHTQLKWSSEDLEEKSISQYIHPDDRDKLLTAIRLAKNAPFTNTEARLIDKDGKYRTYRWNGKNHPKGEAAICVGKDTSDLQEQQEFLSAVVNTLPVAIFCKDAKNEYRFNIWNQAATELWKLKSEAVLGKNDYDFFPKTESDYFREKDESVVRSGNALTIEEEEITLEGENKRILRTKKVPIGNRFLLGISEDITERKRVERELNHRQEQLIEHKAFLQSLIDNCPSVIYAKDLEGRFLLVNSEFEAFFRMKRTDAIGKTNEELFSGGNAETYRTSDQNTIASKKAIICEEATSVDGINYHFMTAKFPLFDKQGNVTSICGISTDISERRRLYSDLEDSKRRLELAIRSGGFGTWDWNLLTQELFWDDYMFEIFDVDRTDFKPNFKAFEQMLLPEDSSQLSAKLAETFRTRSDFSSEFRIKNRAGELRVIRSEAQVLYDPNGKPYRLIGLNRNITEEREHDAMLAHSSKMSTLGEMSAGIAHEINNPLAIISGWTEQVLQMAASQKFNPESLTKYGQSIQRTVDRIATIVKGLRTFARESSSDPFVPEKIQTILSDTLALCTNRFALAQIRLSVVNPTPELSIECRSAQVAQIVLNLLNNAYDAVSVLQEKWVSIEVCDHPDSVEIWLTDSGKGIPEKVREKLAQPFFTTKETGKGTGLGLSISTGLASSHGGTLKIDATCPNTRFVIRLPKHQASRNIPSLKAVA